MRFSFLSHISKTSKSLSQKPDTRPKHTSLKSLLKITYPPFSTTYPPFQMSSFHTTSERFYYFQTVLDVVDLCNMTVLDVGTFDNITVLDVVDSCNIPVLDVADLCNIRTVAPIYIYKNKIRRK